jgi:hypothetical protein
MRDPGEATPASDLILYQTEDGKHASSAVLKRKIFG